MIRFRIQEMIADKAFREKRVVTLVEIAEATGIHKVTLSRLSNNKTPTGTETLNKLCNYFECAIGDLLEHIPD
jgi:putative transcriptional regulator